MGWNGIKVALVSVALASGMVGCSKAATNMFAGEQAKKVGEALTKQLGESAQASRIEISPTQVRVRAADAANPGKFVELLYADGKLGKPLPVSGKADERLFALAGVDFGLVPVLSGEAKTKVGRPVKEIRFMYGMVQASRLPPTWIIETDGDGLAVASMDGKEMKVERTAH